MNANGHTAFPFFRVSTYMHIFELMLNCFLIVRHFILDIDI